MDVKNINKFFVASDVTRTSSAVLDPSDSNYLAKGELVIANEAGDVLDGTSLADNDQFKVYLRSKNGDPVYRSQTLNVSDIKSAYVKQHTDTSHLTYVVEDLDGTVEDDYNYVIKVHDNEGDDYYNSYSVSYVTDTEVDTDGTTLIENIASKINDEFSSDDTPNVEASRVVLADGTKNALEIKGKDYDIDPVSGETFEVPSFNINATVYPDGSSQEALDVIDNKDASIDGVTGDGTATVIANQFTRGSGSYEHVGSMEFATRGYSGDNKITYPHHPYNINLEAKDFDGTGYDILVMNGINRDTEGLGGNTSHPYQVTIALPVKDNATNQASNIYDVLAEAIDIDGTLS